MRPQRRSAAALACGSCGRQRRGSPKSPLNPQPAGLQKMIDWSECTAPAAAALAPATAVSRKPARSQISRRLQSFVSQLGYQLLGPETSPLGGRKHLSSLTVWASFLLREKFRDPLVGSQAFVELEAMFIEDRGVAL